MRDYDALLFDMVAKNRTNGVLALLGAKRSANMTNASGETPLIYAARYGSFDSARILLGSGATPNQPDIRGLTALHYAAYRTDLALLSLLLESKAAVNQADNQGITPLMIAVQRPGAEPVVNTLLAYNADVNARAKNGMTALHFAARSNNVAIFNLLLQRRGNPTLLDNAGLSARAYLRQAP